MGFGDDGSQGIHPNGDLIQASDGNIHGTDFGIFGGDVFESTFGARQRPAAY